MAEINIGEITEALNNKLDLDLGNIDDNENKLDGEWVYLSPELAIATSVSVKGEVPLELDLTDFLPKDDNIYECILSASVKTGTTANNWAVVGVRTTESINGDGCQYWANICGTICRVSNLYDLDYGTCTIPIFPNRKLLLNRRTGFVGTLDFLVLHAYRKVR